MKAVGHGLTDAGHMGTVALLLRGEFATSKAARVSMLYADGGKEKQVRTIMKGNCCGRVKYALLFNLF